VGTGLGGGNLLERLLGRHWRRWEDSIEMDLLEVGWRAWTGLIWLRTETSAGLLRTR
jgi:hypothetical protein